MPANSIPYELAVIPERSPGPLLRALGARRFDGRTIRFTWGEWTPGWGLVLRLRKWSAVYGGGWSLFVQPGYGKLRVSLPLPRREVKGEGAWGFQADLGGGNVHVQWGYGHPGKVYDLPWRAWRCERHDVLAVGGWVPCPEIFAGRMDNPLAATETHPYRYVTDSGEVQEVTATIAVEEREWRLSWLRWLPWVRRVSRTIEVSFSDGVGEQRGSWKGGTVGCSYEMQRGETPAECLRRMQRERRFR
ncbi:conserved protein of unknown function (plasmid) [Rhodovastum atsumiense]|uniref:Uncharacterized protein n=1 Tax=Rhodovastum atsumiense TaxID=504468 RepID=A0A5M6IU45_9PROT|nr:hypothetical protein [Rhodovastum atsumiense]KAA5611840.1 hypothetical protein F1189_12450 [Rhodovastum atsumiense]CAH2606189.1 conserved protein of unknown function [Rhodovastum atsumiense]